MAEQKWRQNYEIVLKKYYFVEILGKKLFLRIQSVGISTLIKRLIERV